MNLYCTVCREPLPLRRIKLKQSTCSGACQAEKEKRARMLLGKPKECPTCKRRYRAKKQLLGAVQAQHNEVTGSV